jgi:hypothetical protein
LIADGLKNKYSSITFDRSLGYRDIEVVNGGKIETKMVYLVKGNSDTAHLQYDRTWDLGLNFARINYCGN